MRTSKLLASGLQLFVSMKMLVLGAFFIVLSLSPWSRHYFFDLFLQNPSLSGWVGYTTLGIGILLFLAFYTINRGQYYQVSLQPPVTVDIKLIQDYAKDYWKSIYPDEDLFPEVILHKNQTIEVVVQLPEQVTDVSFESQKKMLARTEKELGSLLAENLGYQREFLITLLTLRS